MVHRRCRYAKAQLLTRPWRSCFVVVDAPHLLVFRRKVDFVDRLFNPYVDADGKDYLVKRRFALDSLACGPIQTKPYKGVLITHFRVLQGARTVLKLGGPDDALRSMHAALTSAQRSRSAAQAWIAS
mmetsp:Transcript_19392/g.77229  ORF Transcript_19392/g.77229 Transcript_19392/m.77229 type:complete len:127 (+) Transcript_19392:453-833(+)